MRIEQVSKGRLPACPRKGLCASWHCRLSAQNKPRPYDVPYPLDMPGDPKPAAVWWASLKRIANHDVHDFDPCPQQYRSAPVLFVSNSPSLMAASTASMKRWLSRAGSEQMTHSKTRSMLPACCLQRHPCNKEDTRKIYETYVCIRSGPYIGKPACMCNTCHRSTVCRAIANPR